MAMHAPENTIAKRDQWLALVKEVLDQMESWAREEGWSVHREDKRTFENEFGEYNAPVTRFRTPAGEIYVTPIGRNIVGADGRVDIEAWPSLNRVKLVRKNNRWDIITDSNVPLRQDWNQQ